MSKDQLSNSLGNVSLVLIFAAVVLLVANGITTVLGYQRVSNVIFLLFILFLAAGLSLLYVANRLSR